MERAGIPAAHVCSIIPVAEMVGSNRIVAGSKIINPLGNENLDSQDEKDLRRHILEKAIEALQTDIQAQTVFM